VELNSRISIQNEINPDIKILFKRSLINSHPIELKEGEAAPLPFDKVGEKIKILITKKDKTFEGEWFSAEDIISKNGNEVVNYKVGEGFAFNMFVDRQKSDVSANSD
jgi:hypothetical protein